MTPEMKKLFDKFCLAVTALAAVTMILCGKVAAEQQGERIIQGTPYKLVMLESGESELSVRVDDSRFTFDTGRLKKLLEHEKYPPFATFGTVSYFISCVENLLFG